MVDYFQPRDTITDTCESHDGPVDCDGINVSPFRVQLSVSALVPRVHPSFLGGRFFSDDPINNDGLVVELSNEKKGHWLFRLLPNYMGIIINHYKDPY